MQWIATDEVTTRWIGSRLRIRVPRSSRLRVTKFRLEDQAGLSKTPAELFYALAG
jgi:hypothetical protein